MTDLSELIEKLEKATGQLDIDTLGRVICAGFGVEFVLSGLDTGDDGSDNLYVIGPDDEVVWSGYRSRAPDVSMDAALAFVELVLPGEPWVIASANAIERAWAGIGEVGDRSLCYGNTVPLAILIAALKALRGKNDG